jgi:hypothetical protein
MYVVDIQVLDNTHSLQCLLANITAFRHVYISYPSDTTFTLKSYVEFN